MKPAWLYDEFKKVGVDFEDLARVETYDRNQTVSTPEKEKALVARLGIAPGQTVIDLGAGTGTFAIQAALAGASVYAVDVSNVMLTYAQNKAQKMGTSSIAFHRAGFLTYEHPGSPANIVVTKNALHILPDFWKMAAFLRMATLLQPGGKLYLRDVIFSFPPAAYEAAIDEWIAQVAQPFGQGWTAEDFRTHVREEYSTFSWIVEAMLTRAGLKILESNYPSPTYAEYLCVKEI